jgi:propanol-preferring alcohol dehydrogenase
MEKPGYKIMRAMVLELPKSRLKLKNVDIPEPGKNQLLLQVHACGVCRTDLHIVDGELTEPKLPLIIGHEIVGSAIKVGKNVTKFRAGDRIGVPWLGYTCGYCKYCKRGDENLCENAKFTGYTIDGGYAEFAVADQHYCFGLPDYMNDEQLAPLLCAGLIGYRSYRMTGERNHNLGIFGFGGAAHIITQIAVHQGKKVFAFTKSGDKKGQEFARKLGVFWAGGSDELPPEKLNASIIFAPVGSLIPAALGVSDKSAVVVCGGIHMSDIPSFEYKYLWEERIIRSVANLTRRDGEELLEIAPRVPVRTEIRTYKLEQANDALDDLRNGNIQGAAVLVMN